MDQITSLPPLVAALAVSGAAVVAALSLKVRWFPNLDEEKYPYVSFH